MSSHPSPSTPNPVPKPLALFAIATLVFVATLNSARADDRTQALFGKIQGATPWIESLRAAGTWEHVRVSFNDGKKWTWSPDGKWATRMLWKNGQTVIRVWNAETAKIEADLAGDTDLTVWLDEQRISWTDDAKWTTWAGKTALVWNLWKAWE